MSRRLTYDQGEEFEREFGQELEDLGCEPMPTAAITPQQNAVCERHGRIWKTHARRLLDEFSVKFVPEQMHRVILPRQNRGYDHRDDLPHHIRTQLQQSRIRKPAQNLKPDANRLRLDAC